VIALRDKVPPEVLLVPMVNALPTDGVPDQANAPKVRGIKVRTLDPVLLDPVALHAHTVTVLRDKAIRVKIMVPVLVVRVARAMGLVPVVPVMDLAPVVLVMDLAPVVPAMGPAPVARVHLLR
jgi:hypothetical protein